MFIKLSTIILRHRKENRKKCSLRGLELRKELLFFSYPQDNLPEINVDSYLLLDLEGPVLSEKDSQKGLFLIDGTWRYARKMKEQIIKKLPFKTRSLPKNFITVYPRKQTKCLDPIRGLASVEALFLAHLITKKTICGLLDHYYWKQEFLKKNRLLSINSSSYNYDPIIHE